MIRGPGGNAMPLLKQCLTMLVALLCACEAPSLPSDLDDEKDTLDRAPWVDVPPKQPSGAAVAARIAGTRIEVYSLEDGQPRGAFETMALLGTPALVDSVASDAGTVVIDRRVARERLEPHGDFVAQSWEWSAAPGSGAIVVDVAFNGLIVSPADGRPGLGFLDPSTGRAVRYGGARFIDAAGVVTRIAPTIVEGVIRLVVPANVTATSEYPALLDPEIGPDLDVDGPIVGQSGYADEAPVVAHGLAGALVVWTDSRNGRETDLYGARLGDDGSLMDALPLAIVIAPGHQYAANIAAFGSGWIVVWTDDRSGGTAVWATTVSAAGEVATAFPVSGGMAEGSAPAVHGGGERALVAWSAGGDILAALVSQDGTVAPLGALTAGAPVDDHPDIAQAPTGDWLVVYDEDSAAIRGVRVSSAGALLDGSPLPLSVGDGFRMYPSVAWSGSSYLLAFSLVFRVFDVQATRVSIEGTPLDLTGTAGGISIAVASSDQRQASARVACNGGTCGIAWHRGVPGEEDVVLQVTTDAMIPIGLPSLIGGEPRPQQLPDVSVSSSGQTLAVWQDQRGGAGADIYAARVTAASSVLDGAGIPVSMGFNRQLEPAIVARDGGFLVTWSDSGSGPGFRIHARHLDFGARAIGSTAVIGGSTTGSATTPSISTPENGRAVIAWSDTRAGLDGDVYASIINTVGMSVIAEVPIVVRDGMQVVPAVAAGADTYLVVWQDRREGTFDIRGTVLNMDGSPLAADFAVAIAADDQVLPHAAFDPVSGHFVVVWQDSRDGGDRDIVGARISETGAVLDPDGFMIAGAPGLQERPRVSTSMGTTLVAWADQRIAGNRDVYASRLDLAALDPVLDVDGILLCGALGKQTGVDIDPVPDGFVIAWQDFRDDVAELRGDIYSVTFSVETGIATPADGLLLAGNPTNEASVSLALSEKRGVFAYSRRHDDLEADRVEARSYRP